jgi:hypothetical protein
VPDANTSLQGRSKNKMKKTKKIFPLTRAAIDGIFENSKDPYASLVALYRAVIIDFPKARKVENYPMISRNTSVYIIDKMQNQGCDKGLVSLLWLNNGFSSSDHLPDWTVDINKVILHF